MPAIHRSVRPPGLARLCLMLSFVATGGCTSFMFGQTGKVMSAYTEQHVVPYLFAQGDVGLACRTGAGLGTFVSSFGRVSPEPHLAALVSAVGAGMCAEMAAWEAELAYERALRAGRAAETRDAQIAGQRMHLVAARRYLTAWQRTEKAFGELGGKCPVIEPEHEVFFAVGLASGLLALMHDRSAGGAAGVSMATPRKVERASKCVANERWWGLPRALAAVVWLTVPGSAPTGTSPEQVLAESAAIGDKAQMRLARSMQVIALAAKGDDTGLRAAIAAHGKALAATPAAAEYRLLDAYAAALSRHQSDLIWTRETGHRGPLAELGPMPMKPAAADSSEDDDLIEGMGDDEGKKE